MDTYSLDDTQCSVPGSTRLNSSSATTATTAHATATVSTESTRAVPSARVKRTRKQWVNPVTDSLRLAVEPNCAVCNCSMGSWDSYYDHIMFDQAHTENLARSLPASSNLRSKPTQLTASSPSSSSSSILYMKGEQGSPAEDQTSSPIM
ncbi:hypothetical protein GGH13_008853 [Coemansia sp. S155-1]|nr:hypothetical protein GGH13_008853 [Coemansia sp. S155-1]